MPQVERSKEVVDFEPDRKAFAARISKLVVAEVQTGKRWARFEGFADLPCVIPSNAIIWNLKRKALGGPNDSNLNLHEKSSDLT